MRNPIPPKYRRAATWVLAVVSFLGALVAGLRGVGG
jgi:hypothetical protein